MGINRPRFNRYCNYKSIECILCEWWYSLHKRPSSWFSVELYSHRYVFDHFSTMVRHVDQCLFMAIDSKSNLNNIYIYLVIISSVSQCHSWTLSWMFLRMLNENTYHSQTTRMPTPRKPQTLNVCSSGHAHAPSNIHPNKINQKTWTVFKTLCRLFNTGWLRTGFPSWIVIDYPQYSLV
jgi:hypothetical protein